MESIWLPDYIKVSLLSLQEEPSSAPALKLMVFLPVKLTKQMTDTRLPVEVTYNPLPLEAFQYSEISSHTKRKSTPQTSRDETRH